MAPPWFKPPASPPTRTALARLAPLAPRFAEVCVYYMAYKLVVRILVGCRTDERGWGRPETYICAFVHQVTVVAASAVAVWQNRDALESWLTGGWGVGAHTIELALMLANCAEMLTDCAVYARYPGFGLSYWLHHCATFGATAAFLALPTAPIGYCTAYAGLMELGGAVLNFANIAEHPLAFTLRVFVYSASRLGAAALLVACTAEAVGGHIGVPLAALAPVWVLMALNLAWVADMVKRFVTRQPGDPWTVPAEKRA